MMKKLLVILLCLCLAFGLTACSYVDDDIVTIYVAVAVIAFAINLCFCLAFANAAATKGYSYSTYFALCFFFGMIGYILVAALPDLTVASEETIKSLEYKLNQLLKMQGVNPTVQKTIEKKPA